MKIHAFRLAPRTLSASLATILAALFLAACASMSMPARVSNGALTDQKGMTLYTFDRDVAGSGKSACNGPCLANWPAFMATSTDTGSGDWTVVTRDEGTKQWAFKGKPLYTFAKDTGAGETKGEGFNNVWHIARP